MKRLLGIKLLEQNITFTELASKLAISKASLSKKMNGKVEFKKSEILKIKQILSLSALDIDTIFFS